MRLYDWQKDCLAEWEKNHFRGIVNVVTGAGKTVLAIEAIRLLSVINEDLKVKIIVPKTFLIFQWINAVRNILGIERKDIGIFAGGQKNTVSHKFMIYVINSARYNFSRHMIADKDSPVLIIADECHHYGAEENSKIFDFFKIIPDYPRCYTLGLSATPYCKNYKEVLVPNLGGEIYSFNFIQAIEADIISRFSLFNISISFTAEERAEYEDFSLKISLGLARLKKHCPQLYSGGDFFAKLNTIAAVHKNYDVRGLAQSLSFLLFQRKEIVHLASARIACVTKLLELLGNRPKIIIFCERIETAELIYKTAAEIFPGKVGLYHSRLAENVRRVTLRNFEDTQIRILVSCKNLDEGLNITDTDVGIVVSSTSTERQRVQRLGRVLRKKPEGSQASFYYLYVSDTIESEEIFADISDKLKTTIRLTDLTYDDEDGFFLNARYERLAVAAVKAAEEEGWARDKITELVRNIVLGTVRADSLMSKEDCGKKISAASSRRERNYYKAMLYLIRNT